MKEIAFTSSRYPDGMLRPGNNIQNQLETPILLYAGAAVALAVNAVNGVMAAAVVHVATRCWHRFIHVRYNRLARRFKVFVYGLVALAVFWLALAFQLLLA